MKKIKEKLAGFLEHVFSNALKSSGTIHAVKESLSREQPLYMRAGPMSIPAIYVKNIHGQRVLLDPRDLYLTLHYLDHRDWEDHLHAVFMELPKKTLYVDVGANVGLHVLRGHLCGFKKIVAFEPDKKTFELLKQNISINGGYEIDIHSTAVGAYTGEVGFEVDIISTGMSKISNRSETIVSITTLDDMAFDHESFGGLLLKIDVEGYEGDVIKGAINTLDRFHDVTLIIEFGSRSSIDGVKLLYELSEWDSSILPWRQDSYCISKEELISWDRAGVVDLVMKKRVQ